MRHVVTNALLQSKDEHCVTSVGDMYVVTNYFLHIKDEHCVTPLLAAETQRAEFALPCATFAMTISVPHYRMPLTSRDQNGLTHPLPPDPSGIILLQQDQP